MGLMMSLLSCMEAVQKSSQPCTVEKSFIVKEQRKFTKRTVVLLLYTEMSLVHLNNDVLVPGTFSSSFHKFGVGALFSHWRYFCACLFCVRENNTHVLWSMQVRLLSPHSPCFSEQRQWMFLICKVLTFVRVIFSYTVKYSFVYFDYLKQFYFPNA